MTVAIIFGGILTVIVASFLGLANQEAKMADRSFLLNVLLNLAEGGADDAIWSINQEDWSDWTVVNGGADRFRRYTNLDLGNGKIGEISILVVDFDAREPTIFVEGSSNYLGGQNLVKQLMLSTGGRALAAGGMISKDKLSFSGQICADSYNSQEGPYDEFLNRGDKSTVGSVSTAADAVDLSSNQIDIYGQVGTGAYEPIHKEGTRVYGEDTPDGVNWDTDRVHTDFEMEFPDVEVPPITVPQTKLPAKTSGVITLGTPGAITPTEYNLEKFDLSGKVKVEIVGPVVIHVQDGISMSGQAYVEIIDGGSAEIYTAKDISISGQGIVNSTEQPSNMLLFGTNTIEKGQTISMSGQADFHGVVYAPYAIANFSGQAGFFGSVTAQEIKVSGQGCFHYDENLGDLGDGRGKKLTSWRELVAAEERIDFSIYYYANYYPSPDTFPTSPSL